MSLLKKIIQNTFGEKPDEPVAVQCLWVSDWDYLGILIELIFKDNRRYRTQKITELAYSNFETEEKLIDEAKRIGKEYADRYNIELYFPSPDEWSRDCPNWWEKDAAPQCEDCKIPIVATDSQYLPKEVCYPCHLKRESNARIKKAEAYDDGVKMYLVKEDLYENIGYCSKFESYAIAPFIHHLVQPSEFSNAINTIIIGEAAIKELIEKLEGAIDKALENYHLPEMSPEKERFESKQNIRYKNREIVLLMKFNAEHRNIYNLISEYNIAQKALNENYVYHIYFKKGITHRDDAILRFVHFVSKNKANKSSLTEHFKNVLTESELMESVSKLEKCGCLTCENSVYQITEPGKKIL